MKNVFKRLDPRLAAELKSQRAPIMAGLLCVGGTALLTAVNILVVKYAIAYIQNVEVRELNILCLGVVGMFVVKYYLTRGQWYYLSLAATRLASDLRTRMFDKLQHLPVSYFNRQKVGRIQSVLANDVAVYQSAVMIVRDSIDGPIRAVVALVTVFYLQWQLAVLALMFVPPIALFVQANGRKMKVAQAQVQEDQAQLLAVTQEALQGERVIKAFAAEGRISDTHKTYVEKSFASQMHAVKRMATLKPMVELIGATALALVLYVCGYLSQTGQLSVSNLMALIVALDTINGGMRTLGYVNSTYNQVQAASERIYGEILDVPLELEDLPDARELPSVRGKIEFRNVSFTYPDGTPALKDVSFVIPPGTSLALVGPSGAGKSTVADLLLRFYEPTSGVVLLDDVDIRELKMKWLRAQMGVVPQHTFLFAGSIADNIRLGAPEASEEDIREAAHAAHVDVFVDGLPNRYLTEIGESGVGLSGGEKQRVAIARAVVRKPEILLLDEATSNLDAVSEKHVQEALDEIMQERTTLFIAHRLTSAARADKILVLRRGEVLESGTHRQLMEQNGAYAGMYKAFSSGVLGDDLG